MLLRRSFAFLSCLLLDLLQVQVALGDLQKPLDRPIKSISLRTHTLTSPYLDSDLQSRWFDFGGDTIIRADQYIRLTSNHPSQRGWIFSRVPLTSTNWEVEVEFKIHGKETGNLHGDGFAIWVTKQRGVQGPVFGHTDEFEGLGIFFDTYKNGRAGVGFPYVMAMLGDGHTKYDHVNDGKDNELAGCSARGIRNSEIRTKARLTYFQDNFLKLELQHKAEGEWIECFTVNDIRLPTVAYLGFSAETGELSDNHDILSVNSNSLYESNKAAKGSSDSSQLGSDSGSLKKAKPSSPIKPEEGFSWSWMFFKFIMVLVGIAMMYVGYTAWRTQQRRQSSRF